MKSLALALAATLLALFAAELSLRALGVGPRIGVVYAEMFQLSSNPRLRYELRPGAQDGGGGLRISSVGHRGEDVPQRAPPGTFRIAAVGDSVTFGFGVQRAQAWPAVLEGLLREAAGADAPRFEVLNFGVTGYDVEQVAERTRTLVSRFAPDLYVYGYVLNDPQDVSFEGEALEQIAEHERGAGIARWLSGSRLFLLLRAASGARHYAHTPEGTLRRGDGSPVALEIANDPAVDAALLRGDLDYFRALHRRAGARLRSGLEALAAAAGEVPVLLAIFPLFTEQLSYPLRDVHALVRAEAERVGLRVVDLLPAFEAAAAEFGPRRHVGNVLHPNAFGYRVAARSLRAALLAQGLLPMAGSKAQPAGDRGSAPAGRR